MHTVTNAHMSRRFVRMSYASLVDIKKLTVKQAETGHDRICIL